MGTGNLLFSNRQLRRLILPLVLEQLLAVTVGLMDTVMVSAAGEPAVSGVALVDEIMILMINIFAALGTGGAVVVGHAIGAKDRKAAGHAAGQTVLFISAFALLVTAALYLARGFVLHTVFGSIEPAVERSANIYYLITAASIPFIALYNAGAAIFRVMGNSAVSMCVSFLMNGINVTGNAILIYGFQMGAEGVAIPTLVSRMTAAAVITALLFREKYPVHLSRTASPRPDWWTIRRITRIGIPSGLENGLFQLGKILTISIISGLGTAAITAHAVATKAVTFQIMAGAATGLALVTVTSQCLGAGQYDQIRYYAKKLLKFAYLSCTVMVVLTLLAMPVVLRLYHLSEETAGLATRLILYHSLCTVTIWPAAWTFPNMLRASGDVRFTMTVAISSMWIFRVGGGWLLGVSAGLGVFGVWVAMTVDWLFRAICFLWRYRSGKWMDHQV